MTRPLRVVHVITTLTTGGAERQLELLVQRSTARTTTIALYEGGPVAQSMQRAGADVQVLGMAGWRKPLAPLRLARRLRRLRPDVVHVHLLAAQLWGVPAARLAGVPVVVSTEHSLMDTTIEGRPHTPALRLVYRALERLTTHGGGQRHDRGAAAALGVDADRITVIDNGLDLAALRPDGDARRQVRAELGLTDETVLGVVGRLDPVKRVDEVVDAVAPLLREGRTALVVAGAGPLEPALRAQADALGVGPAVHLLGARAPDVPRVLAALDVLVSASRDETFGLAVLEGLAAGLPVVYAQCPALEELPELPDSAFPAGDGGLLAAVGAALAHGRSPAEQPVPDVVRRRYDVDVTARRVDALYARLLTRQPGGRPVTTSPRPGRRLVLASRGDALTPYLQQALERRYGAVDRLDPELRPWQRYLVAAATFRPSRTAWVERFYKSGLAYRLRSVNAARLRRGAAGPGPVLQVHALFETGGAHDLLYVDCTHRQSAEHWPAWNPLRGSALQAWYARERRAYHGAGHLFAFSSATRDSLVGDYGVPQERVSVVGAGVNADVLPPPRPGQPDGPPVLLFVGNDFARKGGPVLLDAFRLVRQAVPDARLVLVGTDPDVPAQEGVEVLGRVHDRERVLALYREASVFCLPSVFDPFPLVLLEAAAAGVPVVATPTCGVPEMVTDGVEALLVPAGDPGRLAEAVLELLRDPERATALAKAARARVEAELTWDRTVERMAPVLDPLLAG